jgi:nicotinamide-nucleotide amidase
VLRQPNRVEFQAMRAEILTIGDELCRGEIVDTNSSYLAQRLWDLDITTRWMTSCCD